MTSLQPYVNDAVALLSRLIATPSVSRDESRAADIMEETLRQYGFAPQREANNVWAQGTIDENRPTLLLNAHLDTVKPVASWTRDPFTPIIEDDCLFGLGSNDCGGGLVTLLQAFRLLASAPDTPYNLLFLASSEEEVSGANGIERALPLLPHVDVAIVGEPTQMQPAIAEKGLMVIDVVARGKSGHAARAEGVNAIYKALDDLNWLSQCRFDRVSPLLGPTLIQVTQISAGTQHNVVPDECRMVIDVRTNECYTNKEVFEYIARNLSGEAKARSFRLQSSSIAESHPIVERCKQLGLKPFGSPTLSDQALMPFPSLKLGPGDSSRSHTADEYIRVSEIASALELYMEILS